MSNMRLVRNAMFRNQASGIVHHVTETRNGRFLGFLWRRGKKTAITERIRIRNDAKLCVIETTNTFELARKRVQQMKSKRKRRLKVRKHLYPCYVG